MIRQAKEAVSGAVDDLRSVGSSPERDANNDDEFKVVIEEADEAKENEDDQKSQTIEENYRETVELVKKYIRVEVPNIAVKSDRSSVVTTRKAEPQAKIVVSPPSIPQPTTAEAPEPMVEEVKPILKNKETSIQKQIT